MGFWTSFFLGKCNAAFQNVNLHDSSSLHACLAAAQAHIIALVEEQIFLGRWRAGPEVQSLVYGFVLAYLNQRLLANRQEAYVDFDLLADGIIQAASAQYWDEYYARQAQSALSTY